MVSILARKAKRRGFESHRGTTFFSAYLQMFGLSQKCLLTKHGSMNEFLNKRGLSDTDLCGCGRVENVSHITYFVFKCELYMMRGKKEL